MLQRIRKAVAVGAVGQGSLTEARNDAQSIGLKRRERRFEEIDSL
jgi:hypothetical protein